MSFERSQYFPNRPSTRYFTSSASQLPPSSQMTFDLESVQKSFEILDALVEDQISNNHNPPVVSADTISKVLVQWKTWQRQATQPITSEWSTDAVAAKVWAYQKRLPELPLWIRSSYDAILSGYKKEIDQNSDKTGLRQASAFMEGILEQLRQGGPASPAAPSSQNFEAFLRLHITARDLPGAMAVLDYIMLQKCQGSSESRSNFQHLRFDGMIFQDLLQACTKLPMPPKQHRGTLADSFLKKMRQFEKQNLLGFRPATEHFTQVISAWTRSQDRRASQRAMQIFEYLQKESESHPKHALKPDSVLVGAVMNALAKTGKADKAEQLMYELVSEDGLGPDRPGINSVIFGLANTKAYNAGERAEKILRTMQRDWSKVNPALKPDHVTYTGVIHAWGLSGHPKGRDRAEELFEEMTRLAAIDPAMEPNQETYGCLLNAFAKVGDVPKTSQLLSVIANNYETGKNTKVAPNNHMFSMVMNAMAKSNRKESGQAAEELLRKMERLGIKNLTPETYNYNIVINAWARSGQESAGKNAERLLREMQNKAGGNKKVEPRLVSFMLSFCRN